ncbi:hypothetical protein SAMN02745857_03598 [Andreprevotia lacus DSM 23236]|jgi:peptidoglycan/LPS O-acetylase OafA/YrhL|uniref:Uncharacterized protein n=1 Tax=Andreprevotia lacus DSM 23236 TaxID=1121001 RepID=A0A1W1XYV6_9NEIS|nr:hypothetical protein [Andreprevotia lacus]SMC29096.1 hypothetical protein SAMN02745857_03598 [Andreprevotia lacus DSM 23236]
MPLLLALLILIVTPSFACGCIDESPMSMTQWGYIGLAIFLQLLPYLWVFQRASGARRQWRRRALLTLVLALAATCVCGFGIWWLEPGRSLFELLLLVGFSALYFPGYVLCWHFHRGRASVAPA